MSECTCELVDVSTRTEIAFTRGRSNGCKVHPESDYERDQREKREAYEQEKATRAAEAQRRAREA